MVQGFSLAATGLCSVATSIFALHQRLARGQATGLALVAAGARLPAAVKGGCREGGASMSDAADAAHGWAGDAARRARRAWDALYDLFAELDRGEGLAGDLPAYGRRRAAEAVEAVRRQVDRAAGLVDDAAGGLEALGADDQLDEP